MPAGLAAAIAILPLAYLAVRATEGGFDRVIDVLARDRTLWLTLRSVALAATVTAVCLVVGIVSATLVTRLALPGRRALGVLFALPLAVPSYVAALGWVSLFPGFGGFGGSVLVLSAVCFPYVHLPVAAAMHRIDPAGEETARSLGRGPVRAFVAVTLPQLRPAATAGALLVALYTLSDFGAVAILRYDAFTRVIYQSYRGSFDPTPAAIAACLLVAITVAIVWGEGRTRGRARYARIGAGTARSRRLSAPGRWTSAAVMFCVAVLGVGLVVPFGSLAYWLIRGRSDGLSVDELVAAAGGTLAVSALGALVTVALALPIGILAARWGGHRLPRLFERAAYLAHALPGVVVGLALVFLTVRYAHPLYQRTPGLLLAYAVLFLPVAVGAIRASVAQSPPALEEVARSLGRRTIGVLRSVTLPLAAPGVAAGAALVFVTAMKELPATLMLRPIGTETLATRMWSRTEVGEYAGAAPYAAALVLLAALPAFWLGGRTHLRDLSDPVSETAGEEPE